MALSASTVVLAACEALTPATGPHFHWPVLDYQPSPIFHRDRLSALSEDSDVLLRLAEKAGQEHGPPPVPRIVASRRKLQCVPFARRKSSVGLRGHAWHWWNAAKGHYRRGQQPERGAVMVFKRNGRSRGHLAVVTQVIDDRVIIVDHANWLNQGRIHLNTPVRDVSRDNDWSVVRVWYTPGHRYGSSGYRVHGFIYPEVMTAAR